MSKMMKICGKTPSNTAAAIAVDADGMTKVKHIWETVVDTICSEAIADESAHYYPGPDYANLDVRDFALISIYVQNHADKPVTIILADSGNYIRDSSGNRNQVVVDSGTSMMITADDFACLNVVPEFSIRAKYNEVPTNSGYLIIKVNKKR